MYAIKYTENKEKIKLLSLFIDNIYKERLFPDVYETVHLENYYFIIVRNGILDIYLEDTELVLKKNEGLYIKKGGEIILKADKDSPEECWSAVIEFNGSGVPGMMEYLWYPDYFIFNIKGSAVLYEMDDMILRYETGEYFRASVILQTVLLNIRDYESRDFRSSNMNEIYEYIHDHYAEQIDVNILAEMYGTSTSYFSRMFRKNFNIPPMQFVNEIRLMYARIFLETTHLKVRDIAEKCGFETMEYFCSFFKKHEGCTPTQYRENRRRALRGLIEKNTD